jgi:hypothetical protein
MSRLTSGHRSIESAQTEPGTARLATAHEPCHADDPDFLGLCPESPFEDVRMELDRLALIQRVDDIQSGSDALGRVFC